MSALVDINPQKILEDNSLYEEEESPKFATMNFLMNRNQLIQLSEYPKSKLTLETEINIGALSKAKNQYIPFEEQEWEEAIQIDYPIRIESFDLYKIEKSIQNFPFEFKIKLNLVPGGCACLLFHLDEDAKETEKSFILQFQQKYDRVTIALLFPDCEAKKIVYFKRREMISGNSQKLENEIELTYWDTFTSDFIGKMSLNGFEEIFKFPNCLMPISKDHKIAFYGKSNGFLITQIEMKYFNSSEVPNLFKESQCSCNCNIF